MPGTVVHLAFSGMIAAALLGAVYDRRSVLVVLGVTAVPDLDAFLALVTVVGHRALLHNFVIPLSGTALVWADTRLRARSLLLNRLGPRSVRIAWVSILVYAVSAIGLDLVNGVVNPFWPVHDQFYTLDGKVELSDQRGVVQTFVDLGSGESVVDSEGVGSSQEVNLSTGVDPDPSGEKTNPERIFPVVRSGWELVLLVVGTAVTVARFYLPHDLSGD
jgi:inner membrane protein